MEEDGDVKAAPVTRLRRRLSVEPEDAKSSPAPSTPTKKKSTRLAAKPQLELIDENAVTNSPKKTTRKSIARELAELENKPVTPARRSTRTKSNTSLVSEPEEKPVTPARRASRIKSNTSLVLETATQSVESPRATRAATRASQAVSDTEPQLTPAKTRQTRRTSTSSIDKEDTGVSETAVTPGKIRRTRKSSISSIDAPVEAALAEKPSLITEVIEEEPEAKLRKSTSTEADNVDDKKESPVRKSPRIAAKKGRKSTSEDINDVPMPDNGAVNMDSLPISTTEPSNISTPSEKVTENDISISNADLIEKLDMKQTKNISDKNKSVSDTEDTLDSKKRRTKSWTTMSASPIESHFFSDSEVSTSKSKKHGKIFNDNRLSNSGAGDGNDETTMEEIIADNESSVSKKSRKSKDTSLQNNMKQSISDITNGLNVSNESDKENILNVTLASKDTSAAEHMFEKVPIGDVKSMVIFEDSDSNTGSIGKQSVDKPLDAEDQCVPVVLPSPDKKITSEKPNNEINIFTSHNVDEQDTKNCSVEPMDIDETIPENVSLSVFTEEGKQSGKTSLSASAETEVSNDNPNKSKRKSSVSHSISQILENSYKQDIIQKEKSCKLSLNATEETEIIEESTNKSKRKSSNSQSSSGHKEDKNNANAQDSSIHAEEERDESVIDKNGRKSSLITTQNKSTHGDNEQDVSSLGKKTRKSSLNTSQDSTNQDKNKKDDSASVTKSRKSVTAQLSDSSLNESFNKKRISKLSNSVSQENQIENGIVGKDVPKIISSNSSISTPQNGDKNLKESKKSKKNSSLSSDHENTENKSTLVLSQIRDTSSAENNVTKSPQITKELSKSITSIELGKDAPINRNVALNYNLTSTPVQEKNIEKLTIQMNTSVITPTCGKKHKITCTTTSKNVPMTSKSLTNESSHEDSEATDEDDQSTRSKNDLFDGEAEDAGDVYESGDSRDEDERQYELDNKIHEKGETLTSEDESSNDSDYEKDSFLVSSDEEDNELLSGSGDDLDMSDNELTLSAKSKKVYNERKLKEQKKASREMFEARHGLKDSKSDSKTKKKNRSRLDSALLKSDEDVLPPKKNKRMRLESTQETSQVKSDSEDINSKQNSTAISEENEIGYKKKKSKRLSESVCNESIMNEKEITVCQDMSEQQDPLSTQIKIEPKTPLKDLEISKVHISDDVERVNIDENASMIQENDSTNPLQVTLAQENNDSYDDQSISENEEITNNYDSILKELNEENKRQIKSHDISLNLNKKSKKKAKEVILDELNLTQTKTSKKDNSLYAKEKSVKRVFKKLAETDDVSKDSINLNLFFSDDSNGYEENKTKSEEGAKETFIPLKKSEAKTDIRKNTDAKEAETSLSNSLVKKKKNKKRKSGTNDESVNGKSTNDESINDDNNPEVLNFYVDTQENAKEAETSLSTSLVKKKKNKKRKSGTNDESINDDNNPDVLNFYVDTQENAKEAETSLSNSLVKKKKNKKRKSGTNDESINDDNNPEVLNFYVDTQGGLLGQGNSAKGINESDSDEAPLEVLYVSDKYKTPTKVCNAEENNSDSIMKKTPISEKKKKKKLSETQVPESEVSLLKTPASEKKKKQIENKETVQSISTTSDNKTGDQLHVQLADEESVTSTKKRKRKPSANIVEEKETEGLNHSQNLNTTALGNKKKRIKIALNSDNKTEGEVCAGVHRIPESEKQAVEQAEPQEVRKNISVGQKRKLIDDNEVHKTSKVSKNHSLDSVHVPRLPPSILDQLEDKPKPKKTKNAKVVSTSNFIVEEVRRRKNKPSNYLEESVYLNDYDDTKVVTKKKNLSKDSKVLPFLPTVSTSDSGFTTKFQVNVLSQKIEFVARNEVTNFKKDYLNNRKVKKMRTYDILKTKRNKLSKY